MKVDIYNTDKKYNIIYADPPWEYKESGVELAVWYKKSGAKTFNAHCKNTVFKHPNGNSKLHPTAKNLNLFKELLLDNTNENNLVLDTCMGSGTTGVACKELNRNFIGIELDEKYFEIAKNRIEEAEIRRII